MIHNQPTKYRTKQTSKMSNNLDINELQWTIFQAFFVYSFFLRSICITEDYWRLNKHKKNVFALSLRLFFLFFMYSMLYFSLCVARVNYTFFANHKLQREARKLNWNKLYHYQCQHVFSSILSEDLCWNGASFFFYCNKVENKQPWRNSSTTSMKRAYDANEKKINILITLMCVLGNVANSLANWQWNLIFMFTCCHIVLCRMRFCLKSVLICSLFSVSSL